MKSKTYHYKGIFKRYGFFILFSPIILNSVSNFIISFPEIFINFNIYNLISTILFFLFLFVVGLNIKESLNLNTISFGVSNFILSFFIFEKINILFNLNLQFSSIIYLNIIFWIFIFLLKRNNIKFLLFLISSMSALRLFNYSYVNKYDVNANIEVDVWYYIEFSKSISKNGYLFSLQNNIFEGYSQFSSYLHSIFHYLNFFTNNFEYFRSTTNVLFFLSILLIFESTKDFSSKIFTIFLYVCLTINSDWLNFLMIDSLMSEGILNYLFATLVFSIFKEENKSLVFFLFGFLIFSKQFYITLILLSLPIFIVNKNYRKFSIYLVAGYIFKNISYSTRLKDLEPDHHIRQIDLKDTFFDLLLFRNLKIENIILIFKNLAKDVPLSLFIILILFLYLYNLKAKNIFELNYLFFLIVINFILILLLYISVWRYMELESPIRFILNLYLVKFIFLTKLLDFTSKDRLKVSKNNLTT